MSDKSKTLSKKSKCKYYWFSAIAVILLVAVFIGGCLVYQRHTQTTQERKVCWQHYENQPGYSNPGANIVVPCDTLPASTLDKEYPTN